MAASYHKVSPLFWKDRMVRTWIAGGDHRTVNVALYLLTCGHRNSEGLYWLPKAYVAADLGLDSEAVGESMRLLLEGGFIQYDEESEVVFVVNALKYHEPKSKLQLKGAIAALEQVPTTSLFESFLGAASTHAPSLAKEIRKVFKGRMSE